MNHAGSARCLSALSDGPGADLLHAGGEIGDQAEQTIGGVDQAVQAGLRQTHVLQKLVAFRGFQLGDLCFQRTTDAHNLAALFGCALLDSGGVRVAFLQADFVDVGNVERGLHGDQVQIACERAFLVGEVGGARGPAGIQCFQQLGHCAELQLYLAVLGVAGELLDLLVAFGNSLQVGQHQFGVDHVDVRERIDFASHVDDLGIFEAADDVQCGVGRTNVRKELVAEAFALAGTGDQAGNVDELHGGRHDAVGLDEVDDPVETFVRHGHNADVGLNGAEGIIGRDGLHTGQRAEDGALAHVGQTDNSAVQRHTPPLSPMRQNEGMCAGKHELRTTVPGFVCCSRRRNALQLCQQTPRILMRVVSNASRAAALLCIGRAR